MWRIILKDCQSRANLWCYLMNKTTVTCQFSWGITLSIQYISTFTNEHLSSICWYSKSDFVTFVQGCQLQSAFFHVKFDIVVYNILRVEMHYWLIYSLCHLVNILSNAKRPWIFQWTFMASIFDIFQIDAIQNSLLIFWN